MTSENIGNNNNEPENLGPHDYQDAYGIWHIRHTSTWTQNDECGICTCASPTCWGTCSWRVDVDV